MAFFVFWVLELGGACSGDAQSKAGVEESGGDAVREVSMKTPPDENSARIGFFFGGQEVVVKLRDNSTARDLLSRLPLTIQLRDYARTEKVADLPQRLSTEGAAAGFDPSVGDLTYYAPWGNLAFFYEDFGYADGLVPIGTVESGMEALRAIASGTAVKVDRI